MGPPSPQDVRVQAAWAAHRPYLLTVAAGMPAGAEKLNEVLRSTFLAGLTQDDYDETMRVLRHMVGNLERAATEAARTTSS